LIEKVLIRSYIGRGTSKKGNGVAWKEIDEGGLVI
jgi:hypothetical protein